MRAQALQLQIGTNTHELRMRLFWILAACVIAVSLAYVALIGSAIFHILERTNAERGTAMLGASVLALEGEYISFGSTITIDEAYALGYEEVPNVKYIPKHPSLSLGN